MLLILSLLTQLPTWAQAGNPVKAWSRSIFFSAFRDYDPTYGWYDVYFTTPDGRTDSFPLYYTDAQGAGFYFSDELRQRGNSSFFDTDFAVWNESPYNVWSQFGSMSLYMPVNDTNGNGIPDWLERENSANELVTGLYSNDFPATGSYTPTALLTRSAGSLNGNYSLRVGSGPTTFGTWTVGHISGSVSLNSTAGTAAFSVSVNDGPTFTGTTAFTVQNDNQITLAALTLTSGSDSVHTTGNTVFTRTGNRYIAALVVDDGLTDSPWPDFTKWVMEITDTTPPTATTTSPTGNANYPTNSASISLSGTAADDISVTQVTWSNNRGGSGTAAGTTSWSVGNISLLSGTNVITVKAYDAAGNAGSNNLAVVVDTTTPTVAISSPTNGANLTSSPNTLSGTATDPGSPSSGLNLVEVRVNGGSWSNATGITSWTRIVTFSPCGNTIEARSRDNAGNYSGIASNFVTYTLPNTAPNTPSNVSPTNTATAVSITPTLQASVFSDPDCVGDTHAGSQWQVLNGAGAVVVADSGTDAVNKVSWIVPANKLYYGSNYLWRVRYQDSRNAWSSNSPATTFTTGGPLLSGTKLGTNIVFQWPTNTLGFVLQWSTNLGTVTWSNATPSPVVVNGQYAVTNNMTNRFKFYRLNK